MAGRADLGRQVAGLEIVEPCGCNDRSCSSIRTSDHPKGTPYPAGHETVVLNPSRGELNVDVVGNEVLYIEILDREDVRGALRDAGTV